MYEKILETAKERQLTGEFKARIWNNIAACYTKLFCYQKAMYAYDCAWNEKSDRVYLKRMYFLTVMEPELEVKERFRSLLEQEETAEWQKEALEVMAEAKNAAPVMRIHQIFEKDPLKRLAGAGELVNDWKYRYRKMI